MPISLNRSKCHLITTAPQSQETKFVFCGLQPQDNDFGNFRDFASALKKVKTFWCSYKPTTAETRCVRLGK
jgi:hypothetical protein